MRCQSTSQRVRENFDSISIWSRCFSQWNCGNHRKPPLTQILQSVSVYFFFILWFVFFSQPNGVCTLCGLHFLDGKCIIYVGFAQLQLQLQLQLQVQVQLERMLLSKKTLRLRPKLNNLAS